MTLRRPNKTITENLALYYLDNDRRLRAVRRELRRLEWRARFLRLRKVLGL